MLKTFIAGTIAGCIATAAFGGTIQMFESTGKVTTFAVKYFGPVIGYMVGESPNHLPTMIQTDEDGYPICKLKAASPIITCPGDSATNGGCSISIDPPPAK